MQSQTFESSTPESLAFSLQMGSYSIPFDRAQNRLADRILDTRGFLRGFCWALTIEALGALCVYEAWHLWTFLR